MLNAIAQDSDSTYYILLADKDIQIESTEAINNMYNFNFKRARIQFNWLKQEYPEHPISYFFQGLNLWWKIQPNTDDERFDPIILAYMDTVILKAKNMLKINEENVEAKFFLSAAYGLQGRLHAERTHWRKATFASKNALAYLEKSRGNHELSPEFLFGDAVYNYFSVWIPENYPILKPVVVFFPKGDKELGLEQLTKVSTHAFYTRIEAKYHLMRILAYEENRQSEALAIAQQLHDWYPNNPYFMRYYARLLYATGQYKKAEQICLSMLTQIDEGVDGFEEISGRYVCFFLGQIYEYYRRYDEAKTYYERAVYFSEKLEAYQMGYYLFSLLALGELEERDEHPQAAKYYYKKVKKHAKRKHPAFKKAQDKLKKL